MIEYLVSEPQPHIRIFFPRKPYKVCIALINADRNLRAGDHGVIVMRRAAYTANAVAVRHIEQALADRSGLRTVVSAEKHVAVYVNKAYFLGHSTHRLARNYSSAVC